MDYLLTKFPCPSCKQPILAEWHGTITVNCESKQEIQVKQLLTPCKNPFCKWSKT